MIRRALWFLVGFLLAACVGLGVNTAWATTATATYQATWVELYTGVHYSTLSAAESAQLSYLTAVGEKGCADWSLTSDGVRYVEHIANSPTASCPGTGNSGYVSATCPNGGSLGTQYPGWCIVNGQPPPPPSNGAPDSVCQGMLAENQHGPTMIYTPAGSGTANSNAIQPSDVHGSDGVSYCSLEATGQPMAFDKAGNAWWFGWVTGDLYSGSVSPAGSESSGGAACASSGATQVCQSGPPNSGNSPVPGAPSSQLTVGNSNVQLPGSVPNDSCVTTASGAYFCAVGAVQPNNGASPPAPATPDVTITTAAPSSSTNVAPGPSYNLYGPGTVGLSTNYGPGAGSSSTGKSTSTTCTTTNGTQTCTTSATTSASASTATWPSPAFPAGTSPNASIAGAANAIQNSPLVLAASGAIAQTVPAGSCPSWVWNSTLFHTSFDFSNGPAGVCTLANSYSGTLMAVFAAMWVIFGALIILSA